MLHHVHMQVQLASKPMKCMHWQSGGGSQAKAPAAKHWQKSQAKAPAAKPMKCTDGVVVVVGNNSRPRCSDKLEESLPDTARAEKSWLRSHFPTTHVAS